MTTVTIVHAAGLVVAGGDDQRLVGMPPGESERHLHRVVHRHGLVHNRGGVVGVRGGVEPAALGHDEEPLRAVEELHGLRHHVGELRMAAGAVDGEVEAGLVEHAPRLAAAGPERGEVLLVRDHGVAGLARQVEDVAAVVGVLHVVVFVVHAAACEKLEAGVEQVERDVVVFAARLAVRVEPGGRRMDDRDRRHDPDLHPLLVRDLRHGLKPGPVRRHAQRAVVRLLSACDRRRRRRGVGDESVRRARARGALVGQRVHRERAAPGLARELVRDHPLRRGHPVADEHEHVLRRLRPESRRRERDSRRAQYAVDFHGILV